MGLYMLPRAQSLSTLGSSAGDLSDDDADFAGTSQLLDSDDELDSSSSAASSSSSSEDQGESSISSSSPPPTPTTPFISSLAPSRGSETGSGSISPFPTVPKLKKKGRKRKGRDTLNTSGSLLSIAKHSSEVEFYSPRQGQPS